MLNVKLSDSIASVEDSCFSECSVIEQVYFSNYLKLLS